MIKNFFQKLNYDVIEFAVQEEAFNKIEVTNNICINIFSSEYGLVFPIYVSDQMFVDSIELVLLINNDSQWRN